MVQKLLPNYFSADHNFPDWAFVGVCWGGVITHRSIPEPSAEGYK